MVHPVGSYCTDISRCTVNKMLKIRKHKVVCKQTNTYTRNHLLFKFIVPHLQKKATAQFV